MEYLDISWVQNKRDERGDSYYLPRKYIDFIGAVNEIHYTTIAPQAVRGNHYHLKRREFIFLSFNTKWKLAWRPLEEEEVREKELSGSGGVIISVQPNVIHAIKNTGDIPIQLISFSNKRFDPENSDTKREVILK